MRVIAGRARHIALTAPAGLNTRPTTDRIKEPLFNMIQPFIAGANFLDLFSGSGAIGIEALSRGAASCDFVENERNALKAIEDNLKKTKLDGGHIYRSDVFSFLSSAGKNKKYDIIFMDPPYDHLFEKKVIEMLAVSECAGPDTLIIFECSLDTAFDDYLGELGFDTVKVKTYKTNRHVFIKKRR